jgi:transposase-like protein
MLISLHKQATTTPKIRAAIQASTDPAWMVAERYGISEQTVWKWRKRDSVHDLSHTPHKLQTTLSTAQEAVAVTLRTTLLLPLDDLLAVVREFLNPHVSRSGLDRCLRRHGVGNLRDLKPKEAKPTHSSFKAYEPGYLHIDIKYLPQMADEDRRRYLFVAIDRATRWVFVRIYPTQTAANARRFLRDLARAAPMKITRVLTDNGKAFTDRLFGLRKRAATGQHEFDQLCADLGIDSRHQCDHRQMAWSSGSTAGSKTSCKAIGSRTAKILSRPFCAMSRFTTASFRSQHWHPERPCRR